MYGSKVKIVEDMLKTYRTQFDVFLKDYLNDKIATLRDTHPLGNEAGDYLEEFVCAEGKRLRAVLTYYGYLAAGGKGYEKINYASAGMEILHNFFLIHDDIIDKSDFRRNEPTIHKRYEMSYRDKGLLSGLPETEKPHFSYSMAIIIGDICCALAYEALIDSGFDEDRIIAGLKMMHETVKVTAIGEILDIVRPLERNATEEDVIQIHLLKTAKYTAECPLQLGAILQGTSEETLDALSKYAIPIGIAYQIRDDILGIYGEEEDLGKPVGSDIQEGKQTLLTVKAFEKASPQQNEKLRSLIGKHQIDKKDIDDVKAIMEETGSLKYSEDRMTGLIEEGEKALKDIDITKDIKDILLGIAEYMKQRNN